ncbi:hypothetical protein ACHHYP_14858 [Achlya hypogyna]|uniref:Uncharacterized protein n=1 Tax=Achlya hypogyna TaxID=1202772 RepID=A0A1V9YC66_ACHHY|nr:hypothetical protein ACHHYP_14858 [Achlya hypogyna]
MASITNDAWLPKAVALHYRRMSVVIRNPNNGKYPVAKIKQGLLESGFDGDVPIDLAVNLIAHELALKTKDVVLCGDGPDAVLVNTALSRAGNSTPRNRRVKTKRAGQSDGSPVDLDHSIDMPALVRQYEARFKDTIVSMVTAGHRFYIANMDDQVVPFVPAHVSGTAVVAAVVASLRCDKRLEYHDGSHPYFSLAASVDPVVLETHTARVSDVVLAALQLQNGAYPVEKIRHRLSHAGDVPVGAIDGAVEEIVAALLREGSVCLVGTGPSAQLVRKARTYRDAAPSPIQTSFSPPPIPAVLPPRPPMPTDTPPMNTTPPHPKGLDVESFIATNINFFTQRMLDHLDATGTYTVTDVQRLIQGPYYSDTVLGRIVGALAAHPNVVFTADASGLGRFAKHNPGARSVAATIVTRYTDMHLEQILEWVGDGGSFYVSYIASQVRALLPPEADIADAVAAVTDALAKDSRLRYCKNDAGRPCFVDATAKDSPATPERSAVDHLADPPSTPLERYLDSTFLNAGESPSRASLADSDMSVSPLPSPQAIGRLSLPVPPDTPASSSSSSTVSSESSSSSTSSPAAFPRSAADDASFSESSDASVADSSDTESDGSAESPASPRATPGDVAPAVRMYLPGYVAKMIKTLNRVPRFYAFHLPGIGLYAESNVAQAIVHEAAKDPRVSFHRPTTKGAWPYFCKARAATPRVVSVTTTAALDTVVEVVAALIHAPAVVALDCHGTEFSSMLIVLAFSDDSHA